MDYTYNHESATLTFNFTEPMSPTDVKEAIPIDWCHPATGQHLVVFMALSSEVVRWPERLADGRLLKDVADEANTQAEWKWGRWQHVFPDD